MKDPTYDLKKINANPVWKLAFKLSEQENDNAPIGWSKYIARAKLADVVHEVLLKRLRKTINSKRAKLDVRIDERAFLPPWNNLTVSGRATLSGFEEQWFFEFTLRNGPAKDFLMACDLEIPERVKTD